MLLSLFHLNVQGISNCINNINVAVGDLNVHFIALCKHWQNSLSINVFQLESYILVSSYCRSAKNAHGGVVLYTLNSLTTITREDINVLSEEYLFECAAVEVKIRDTCYVIWVVYRPPSTDVNIFIDNLDCLLEIANDEDKLVIVKNRDLIMNLL